MSARLLAAPWAVGLEHLGGSTTGYLQNGLVWERRRTKTCISWWLNFDHPTRLFFLFLSETTLAKMNKFQTEVCLSLARSWPLTHKRGLKPRQAHLRPQGGRQYGGCPKSLQMNHSSSITLAHSYLKLESKPQQKLQSHARNSHCFEGKNLGRWSWLERRLSQGAKKTVVNQGILV